MTSNKTYDPLRAELPNQPQKYPKTYWTATAGQRPDDAGVLQEEVSTDVAIIGAGYTGLSCAYYLTKKYGKRVTVLEANYPGWGCSGRNGSFIRPAIGRLWWWQCVEKYGKAQAKQLFIEAMAALQTMRELIHLSEIDCDVMPDGWLRVAHSAQNLAFLKKEKEILSRIFNYEVNYLNKQELTAYGHAGNEAYGALHYRDSFSAHPLKVVFGLLQLACKAGAMVHSASPVIRWQSNKGKHLLQTPQGKVHANKVVIATNGYSTERLHPSLNAKLLPVLSSIIVTEPLSKEQQETAGFTTNNIITDTRKLLNFYRLLPDNRIMLGSRGAIQENPRSEQRIAQMLHANLVRKFPTLQNIAIDYNWSGWVALTIDSMPRVHSPKEWPGVYYAIGYNGSGTSAAVYAGRLLANGIGAGKTLPNILDQPLKRMPMPAFRRLGQRLAFLSYQLKDR